MVSGFSRSPNITNVFIENNNLELIGKKIEKIYFGTVIGFPSRGAFISNSKIKQNFFDFFSFDENCKYYIGSIFGYGSSTYKSPRFEIKLIEITKLKIKVSSLRNSLNFGGISGVFVSMYSEMKVEKISFIDCSFFIDFFDFCSHKNVIGTYSGDPDDSSFDDILFHNSPIVFSFHYNQTCSVFKNKYGIKRK